MKLHTKIELLKFCSTLLSFIFLALGVSVGGCGLWILFDQSFISVVSSEWLQVVALALLTVAGVILVVGGLGWVGAQRESRLLLLLVSAVLVLLVLAQVFITLLLLITSKKIQQTVMEAVDELIELYPTGQPHLLDNLQHYAECCGRNGTSDWLKNQFVQSFNQSKAEVLPCSCFSLNVTRHEPGAFCSENQTLNSDAVLYGNASYSRGCETALSHWLQENLWTIIGMDLGLILIQILQLAVVMSLFCSFGVKNSVKSSKPDQTEPDLDQDQVYSDQDLLHQDLDQGLYHGPYDGPYGEPYDGPYQEPDPDYRQHRE